MAKKRKVKKKPILFSILIFILLFVGLFICFKLLNKEEIKKNKMFLASEEYEIELYNLDLTKAFNLVRGTEIDVYEKNIIIEEKEYTKINYEDVDYIIDLDQVVLTTSEVVKEKTMYVRTPVTIYKNDLDNSILGYLPKGSEIKIIGFDKLNSDGSVNMYKIKYEEDIGYVYSKYLVKTEELALVNYNVDGIYDTHKDRKFRYDLYGGSPANLDYYPYEKPSFEDNKLLTNAKSLYMNGDSSTISNVDEYIKIALDNNMNMIVVDIKDGTLSYKSEIASNYIGEKFSYKNSLEKYQKAIEKIKEAGLYVVGRIVVFNDTIFAKANPEEAIVKNTGTRTSWVSAYSRKAWEYNVSLAIEAIELFDFNEIQFDYVRFPESSHSMSKNKYDFKNTYNEEKGQAVQNFIFYATDQLHKYNTYISVDVFGECSSYYVTAYGQYWPAISNIVDVISAMPYPDHFDKNQYGLSTPWLEPYKIMLAWGKTAAERQKEIKTPAVARTWLQAYNAIKEPYNAYGAKEFTEQIKGLIDAGLTGGYMPWKVDSSLSKYRLLSEAFKIDY